MIRTILLLGFGLAQVVQAQEQKTTFYGYINSYFEKSADHAVLKASGVSGTPATRGESTGPVEYDVPDIHFVMQSNVADRFKTFLNLKAPGAEGVEVSNAWVESKLYGDTLAFRLGKFYRPFELYNEILDAVPTYIGIEPPELFDGDHLLLTRTTNMMLHGTSPVGPGVIRYSLTTGNDERATDQLPIGLDVRYLQDIKWTVGSSFYTTGGDAAPIEASNSTTGKASPPTGGVLPWMTSDQYQVMGAYVQYLDEKWTFQGSYFTADHNAVRNTAATSLICATGGMNRSQIDRFGCGGTLNANGDYTVTAWYSRLGYNFTSNELGEFTPYLQYDSYTNKETIASKTYGGDKEAGQDDDGSIDKWTLGVVYRPVPAVAIKTDYSLHGQDILGKNESYGEARFSLSYYWRM